MRALQGLGIKDTPDGPALVIRFSVPIRYIRHSPQGTTREANIRLDLLDPFSNGELSRLGAEGMRTPPGFPIGVSDVEFDPNDAAGPMLSLRFRRKTAYEVKQGSDLRSIVVAFPQRSPRPKPTPTTPSDNVRRSRKPTKPKGPRPTALPKNALPERPARIRMLGVQAVKGSKSTEIAIRFDRPVRYVNHSPRGKSRDLSVQIQHPGAAGGRKQKLGLPKDYPAPVEFVAYEPSSEGGARLDIRLREASHYRVKRGANPRSITVELVTAAEFARAPMPEAPRRAAESADTAKPTSELERIFQEARQAMTAGDNDRAIALFTRLRELPEHEFSQDALEFLGLARERKQHLAHAKRIYDEYLEQYPKGPGAQRVRQRLDAMITAQDPARAPLPQAERTAKAQRNWSGDVFGSLSSSYRLERREDAAIEEETVSSTAFSDLFVASRISTESMLYRTELSASYERDVLDGENEPRISGAFLEFEQAEGPLEGSVGRQSGNSNGILGRYDGTTLTYRGLGWHTTLVSGAPVNLFESNSPDWNTYFGGLSYGLDGLKETTDAEVYAIHQRSYGVTDRSAVGAEVRYFKPGRFAAALVDYDVHFNSLNTAFLLGNWQATDATNVNFFFDYRNSPILTTTNARIGQTQDNLGDLLDIASKGELEELAEDRTGRTLLGTVGVTQRLTDRFQISSDVSLSDSDGTQTSEEVTGLQTLEGFEGSGREYSYSLQLTGSNLMTNGDITILGARHFLGDNTDTISTFLHTRFPLGAGFRVSPRISLIHRDSDLAGSSLTYRPLLSIDYRWKRLTLDTEFFYEWVDGERFVGVEDERGWSARAGARYDF